MPWSSKQHKLFEAIAHGGIPPKGGLTKKKAKQMASEGIKPDQKKKSKAERMYKDSQ